MKKRWYIVTLIAFNCIASSAVSQLPPDLDKYVESVLKTFEVPGMSIAIVQNDQVLLAKGYGIKQLGQTAKVDDHTLFPIASNTKAFTAMALAILVDQGKIKWDDPVINHLPWFRMSDPWVTSQITIRDLMVHHSGIPAYAGDILIFPPATYTRRQILEKVKDIPFVNGFRTTYAYDNILYVAAGEVITQVSGMDWQDFVQTFILNKVGMKETVPRFSSLKNASNIATGHLRLQKKVTPVYQFLEQEIGDAGDPAGGIASNAVDMAKWLLTELDSGQAPGHTSLLKATAMNELWNVVTPIRVKPVPLSLKPSQPDYMGYALGVRISNYGKYKTISHGGKLDGFVSHVVLVPGLKVGISVLTNQESTGAYWSVIYHVLDYIMKNPSYDWIKAYQEQMNISLTEWDADWNKSVIAPVASAPVPPASDKYAGTYHDTFYGDITINKDNSGLHLQFVQTPQFKGTLTPFQYETFKATFANPALKADAYITFTSSPDGTVESCTLRVIDPASDISFEGLNFKRDKTK